MTRLATPLQILVVLALSAATGIGLARRDVAAPASAEEKGVRLSLNYVRGFSNWGPTNVYGTAQIWPGEAVASITVHNLPHLLSGKQYVWWVVNTETGVALRLGAFNTTETGDAQQDTYLQHRMPKGANALVVSIGAGKDTTHPGAQRTLSGYFSFDETKVLVGTSRVSTGSGVAGAGTDTAGGRPSTGDRPPIPVELPRTGGAQTHPRR